MTKSSNGWFLRGFFWTATSVLAVFGWVQFLSAPVVFLRRMAEPSLAGLLLELLKPSNEIYPGYYGVGYLFLLLTLVLGVTCVLVVIAVIRGVSAYMDHCNVGISVLKHDVTITFQDAACETAILTREQYFHANKRGISAYHSKSQCDSDSGIIVDGSFVSQSTVDNIPISQDLIIRRSKRSIDVIEPYSQDLRTSLLATYLPNGLVYWLYENGWFKKIVVRRTGRITFKNEFENGQGIVGIGATRYPISQVSVTVKFLSGSEPIKETVKGFVIRENVVEMVAVDSTIDGPYLVYRSKASGLDQEILRIQWP